jgi:hypothetical protein
VIARAQLTFVPGELVPAAGSFTLWVSGVPDRSPGSEDELEAAAEALGLAAGTPVEHPTFRRVDEGFLPVDVPGRRLPLLPTLRVLAALPPGSQQPAWARPSASVLAWSVAAKLGLELVAAGRLLPSVVATDGPGEVRGIWRAVARSDPRPEQLAAAMPVAAHALRLPTGEAWGARELVLAFLDAVADACAREGRRPELDPRRRGPRRPWAQMWADALRGTDPTVGHLRVAPEDVVEDVEEWTAPVLGAARHSAARLWLALEPPSEDAAPPEELRVAASPWSLSIGLAASSDPAQRLDAARVWGRAGRTLTLAGRRLEDPEAALIRGLSAAARMFPALDRALDERAPTRVELAPTEAAALLGDTRDALGAAGVVVTVPGELVEADRPALRGRARRRHADRARSSIASSTSRHRWSAGADGGSGSTTVRGGPPSPRWRVGRRRCG